MGENMKKDHNLFAQTEAFIDVLEALALKRTVIETYPAKSSLLQTTEELETYLNEKHLEVQGPCKGIQS